MSDDKNDAPRGRIATALHYATQVKRPMTLFAYTVIFGFLLMATFFVALPDDMTIGAGIAVCTPAIPMVAAIVCTYLWARSVIKIKPDYFDDDRPK